MPMKIGPNGNYYWGSQDLGTKDRTKALKRIAAIQANSSVDKTIEIAKVDTEEQKVWGLFSVSKVKGELVEDVQGDRISPEELQKAAHNFVLKSRVAGERHDRIGVGDLVESFVFTPENAAWMETMLKSMGADATINLDDSVVWAGAFHITDEEVWKSVKDGTYGAFSIGGRGHRVPLEN